MGNKARAIERAKEKDAEEDVEKRAAEARQKRQDACAKEYNVMLVDLLKHHNCRGGFVIIINGQALPVEQVLNVQVGFSITANIERSN